MSDVSRRHDCRLCGGTSFEKVLPIKPSAIGDAFVSSERLDQPQGVYPLDAYLCLSCGHLQNLDIVDPNILFGSGYTYRTSVSLGLVEHFRKYAESVVTDLKVPQGALVVEIGSNDGSLLRAFQSHGLRVQGVDAASNIAAQATAEGVPTLGTFFTKDLAEKICAEQGAATLVCANNVYAHIDNMHNVTTGIRSVMAPDGVFVFEVSYVPGMIDNMVFDTIYHEHVSYHSLLPLEKFFNSLDLTLFDAIENKSKGGSIRGFAQPLSTGKREKTERLLGLYAEEKRRGIDQPQVYRDYFLKIEERKQKTLEIVRQAVSEGKTVVAYGASTTTTTLLYHFEIGEYIQYIIDDNPLKHGLYSPGYHIPVFPSSKLMESKPDLVVVLAWMYAEPILKKNQNYIDAGGAFLLPLPDVRVVSV